MSYSHLWLIYFLLNQNRFSFKNFRTNISSILVGYSLIQISCRFANLQGLQLEESVYNSECHKSRTQIGETLSKPMSGFFFSSKPQRWGLTNNIKLLSVSIIPLLFLPCFCQIIFPSNDGIIHSICETY